MNRFVILVVSAIFMLAAALPTKGGWAENPEQSITTSAPRATGVIRTFSQTHIVLSNGKVFRLTPVTEIIDLEKNILTRKQVLIPCEVEITYQRPSKKELPFAIRVLIKKILEGANLPMDEAPR